MVTLWSSKSVLSTRVTSLPQRLHVGFSSKVLILERKLFFEDKWLPMEQVNNISTTGDNDRTNLLNCMVVRPLKKKKKISSLHRESHVHLPALHSCRLPAYHTAEQCHGCRRHKCTFLFTNHTSKFFVCFKYFSSPSEKKQNFLPAEQHFSFILCVSLLEKMFEKWFPNGAQALKVQMFWGTKYMRRVGVV